MTDTIKGLNCKVEVALTFGSDLAPTAITKAYPPVVTKTSHGQLAGAAGYMRVTAGMVQMDKQAIIVNNPLTNTFEIPGLDTSDYDTFTAGQLFMAASWGTVAEGAGYAIGGGAQDLLNDTRLYEVKTRNESGLLAGQSCTIDVRNARIGSAAMQFLENKAQRGLDVLIRISQAGTVVRVLYGTPSAPGENVAGGQLASGQIVIPVPGWALKPNV